MTSPLPDAVPSLAGLEEQTQQLVKQLDEEIAYWNKKARVGVPLRVLLAEERERRRRAALDDLKAIWREVKAWLFP